MVPELSSLFDLKLRRQTRHESASFKAEWLTNKPSHELGPAVARFYFGLKEKFKLPHDFEAKNLIKQTQEQALARVSENVQAGKLDLAFLAEMTEHKDRIEAVNILLYDDPSGVTKQPRNPFLYQDHPESGVKPLEEALAGVLSNPTLERAVLASLFGVIEFTGKTEEDPGGLSFYSRFRIVGPFLALYNTTTTRPLAQKEISPVNRSLWARLKPLPALEAA